jgi:WD40 repeat protein
MFGRSAVAVLSLFIAAHASAQAPTIRAHVARTFPPQTQEGREVSFSPDGSLLATSSPDSTIFIWSIPDGKLVRKLIHSGGVTTVEFSPDGNLLASAGYDRAIRLWRVSDWSLAKKLPGHVGTVWTLAFSPDGKTIASGGEDKLVRLWRVSDGAQLHALRGHTLNVWRVAFSPDGRIVASGSFDKNIKLWRVDNGALVSTLSGSKEAVVSLAFSPDGKILASGGDDSMIRLWRLSDGRVSRVIPVGNHVYSVAFSRDGQWLFGAGRGRGNLGTFWNQIAGNTRFRDRNRTTVRIWRMSDGALQQELAGHSDDVWSIDVSRDGHWLATSSEDHTVKLWQLVPGSGH